MTVRTFFIVLGFVVGPMFVAPAWADCTPSGSGLPAYTCASGSTSAQVQSAINRAADGVVITFANGTYSLSNVGLSARNGVTLICATVGGCTINSGGDVFVIGDDNCSSTKTNLMRISGFNFTGTAGSGKKLFLWCNFNVTKLRIDHNDFADIGGGNIAILIGAGSDTGRIYGVIDHNNCHGSSNFMCMKNISGGQTWVTGSQGSGNSLFFEDNVCSFNSMTDFGTGCIDVWRANSTVVRFNTFTNGAVRAHSYCHEGPMNFEVYGNVISTPNGVAPGYRNIHFQGSGEQVVFNNTLSPVSPNGNPILEMQHFRGDPSTATNEGACNSLADGTVSGSGINAANAKDGNRSPTTTYRGYPAWHQPGRDAAATLKPTYAFMNKMSTGTRVDLLMSSGGYAPIHEQSNRDYYNAVSATGQTSPTSPFNGSVGVGFGTLANRPTTCTPTSEALDAGNGGVGYWATDQGNWNTSTSNPFGVQQNGASGVLYRCNATNSWTLHYTPYTYPHPLQAGALSVPSTPTGLRIIG